MGLLQRFFVRGHAEAAPSTTRPVTGTAARTSSMRDLLRDTLQETLRMQGIPVDWIACDLFAVKSRAGGGGIHWRLMVRHWDPRLVVHAVALEEALFQRLQAMDPAASEWLAGITWQFALPDRSVCPPMPSRHTWATRFKHSRQRAQVPDGDASRADLNRWLAQREPDPPRSLESLPAHWAPTQPAKP